jgi:hypothetical protein
MVDFIRMDDDTHPSQDESCVVSAATQSPAGPSVALAIEPRLLNDALAVALRDRGFVVLDGRSLLGGCDVLITSDDDDVVDVRAGVVVRLDEHSATTNLAELVRLIADASGDDVPVD